ncbi:hypothetical protein ABID19_004770 [Mesorhizobium robiniae]|uniref:Activator of Hsp90 ATPase homologue 1/2-like C-terminal domain-containing protein n=1 Tax=Mesorhizobium robiniae TaxID=559315 RepID=A0ABV2GUD2_9HYPH
MAGADGAGPARGLDDAERHQARDRQPLCLCQGGCAIECEILDAEPGRLLRYSWRERAAPGNAPDPFDSIVTFTLDRTVSGGTHLRIVHDGFARVATPAVAMVGAGCRLSLNAHRPKQTIAANTPRLFLRAA